MTLRCCKTMRLEIFKKFIVFIVIVKIILINVTAFTTQKHLSNYKYVCCLLLYNINLKLLLLVLTNVSDLKVKIEDISKKTK